MQEVSKTPPSVKVDVQVSNELRKIPTSQSQSGTVPIKEGSEQPSGNHRKRSATRNDSSSTGKHTFKW